MDIEVPSIRRRLFRVRVVLGQGVPAHIGTPTPGCGYESGDPYASFLPPSVSVSETEEEDALRAIIILREGTEKGG